MSATFWDFWNSTAPELSYSAQGFVRMAYGLLLAGFLLMAWPHRHRFFCSERWGGYARSSQDVDLLQNPTISSLILCVWFGCAGFLLVGWWCVWAALLNLLLSRYFFIHMRWKGLLRGMGAPGFLTYWLAAAVFMLEFTSSYAPRLRSLAL